MNPAVKTTALAALAAEMAACRACRLCEAAVQAVPGEGDPHTAVLFVGEAPGKKEDETGRPFVGRAGKFLDELLASLGWTRADVFIANIVKHRPPKNRDPKPDEVAACAPFLTKQLAIIQPKIVVTLGRHALARFFPEAKIAEVHGTLLRRESDGQFFVPVYHPAAALYAPATRVTQFADFAKIPLLLKQITA